MRGSNRNEKFWKEWDAFCDPIIAGTRASGGRKPSNEQYHPEGCSEELDLFLRYFFSSASHGCGGFPEGVFDDCPPLLEKALAGRIGRAEELLAKLLEGEKYQNIQGEADLIKQTSLSFREFLLPSPPQPGEYNWADTAG